MDERSVRKEIEGYLRSQELDSYFTSIIESCLMSTPTNPSLHIMIHLFKTYPDQIPPTIASAIAAHLSGASHSNKASEGKRSSQEARSSQSKTTASSNVDGNSGKVADEATNEADSSDSGMFTDEEADDADGESPVDATVLKHLAVAADGGIHVSLGGWTDMRNSSEQEASQDDEDDDSPNDDDIYGGDVRTRAEVAVKKIRAVAKQRGARTFVLRRHPSAGWRDGRRHAVSFPTPAPPRAPEPPAKLGPFLTRVRRDQPFLEVLLPALAKCRLCADLTDFQLILLGEACGHTLTAEPGTVVVPAGPRDTTATAAAATAAAAGGVEDNAEDEGQGGVLDSLIVVMDGALVVREVAAPPPPHPRFDDGRQFGDARLHTESAEGASVLPPAGRGGGAAAASSSSSSSSSEGIVLRELAKLKPGDTFGEHALFGPHEMFQSLARTSQQDDGGGLGFDAGNESQFGCGGGGCGGGGSAATAATAKQVVVPVSAGQGCRYWRLPRRTLHALRVQWQKDDEELRVSALRGVPALAFSLSELELRQVAALGEERRFKPGEVVCKEGALLENLGIVLQGFCSFERGGKVLMETVGAGAYWGDLSLVQGPRLCQATVRASPQKILSANGPVPAVFRPDQQVREGGKAGFAGEVAGEDADPTPALVVLVVRVRILERIMGPLVDLLRRHPAPKQAGIFSRIVC